MKILQKEKRSFKIINYCKEGLSTKTINLIIDRLQIEPLELIRKKDKIFIGLKLTSEQLSNKQFLIKIINQYPKLLERPIILNDKHGVIGRPVDNIYRIL